MPEYITPEELSVALSRARAASLDGSVNMTELVARLEVETGRTLPPAVSVPWDDPSVPPQARELGRRMQARSLARLEALVEAEERGRRSA
ncbi:hypothetical protein GCM10027456_25400 [Kineosporia babensis]